MNSNIRNNIRKYTLHVLTKSIQTFIDVWIMFFYYGIVALTVHFFFLNVSTAAQLLFSLVKCRPTNSVSYIYLCILCSCLMMYVRNC